MAVLNESDRWEIWRDLMRMTSEVGASLPISKVDFRAAIDGVDDGFEADAAVINQWFPQPARSSLAVRWKAFIIAVAAMRRALRS